MISEKLPIGKILSSNMSHKGMDSTQCKKGTGSPYSITELRVLELIPVLDSQPAGDVSHTPGAGSHYFLPGPQFSYPHNA